MRGSNTTSQHKVCFISLPAASLFNPELRINHGGAELQMYLWATELARDDRFLVSFVTGDIGNHHPLDLKILVFPTINPNQSRNRLKNALRVFRALIDANADTYLTTTKNQVNLVVSLFCLFFRRTHIHRTANEPDVDDSYKRWSWPKRSIYRFIIDHADQLITQNESHRGLLQENYHREATVIKNGFQINSTVTPKDEFCLWVGRNVLAKQPQKLVQLARSLPEVKFTVVCNPSTKEGYTNLAWELDELENVDYHPRIDFSEIQSLFDRARVFVSTSVHEGFPNTFIQAGLGKTPIVSLNVDPDQFIQENRCGFVCGGDDVDLQEKVKLLQDDAELCQLMGENLHRYVATHHDISKNSTMLKRLLLDKDELN